MRKTLFALLCLVSSSCAHQRPFDPMDNCVPSLDKQGVFSCIDINGKSYVLIWENSRALVCFKAEQLKLHEETCRQK